MLERLEQANQTRADEKTEIKVTVLEKHKNKPLAKRVHTIIMKVCACTCAARRLSMAYTNMKSEKLKKIKVLAILTGTIITIIVPHGF